MKILLPIILLLVACGQTTEQQEETDPTNESLSQELQPNYVTAPVATDSDDPAIWVHPTEPSQSLIVGTDKGSPDGGLYVFDLQGKKLDSVKGLLRPNNVDLAWVRSEADTFAVVVCTERQAGQLRAFRMPDLAPIDGGGFPLFEGEENRAAMGIALFERPSDGAIFAQVSRKTEEGSPADSQAIWQYQLTFDGTETKAQSSFLRRFGQFSGQKEIEAMAVDNQLGYLYYSDEGVGVRRYFVDPDSPSEELALFGTQGFAEDHEGIAIYPTGASSGYITVSDQGAQRFHFFDRESLEPLGITSVAALKSDGSEAVADSLNEDFPQGLFVAMSDDRTFHLYDWRAFLASRAE